MAGAIDLFNFGNGDLFNQNLPAGFSGGYTPHYVPLPNNSITKTADKLGTNTPIETQNAAAQLEQLDNAQKNAMEYNKNEAQKARDWQDYMYQTRFQKTIADIKKAGLNPYIINTFAPGGGFSSGGAAQIASNVMKAFGENKNTNKRQATGLEWLSAILPFIGTLVGGFFGGAGHAIGGTLGSLASRALLKRKK